MRPGTSRTADSRTNDRCATGKFGAAPAFGKTSQLYTVLPADGLRQGARAHGIIPPVRSLSRSFARALAALVAPALVVAQAAAPAPVRVCAGGDVSIGANVDPAGSGVLRRVTRDTGLVRLVAPLQPVFAAAQVAIVNVEGAIGEGEARAKCTRGAALCYAIRQPPEAAVAIRAIAPHAAVVANVANNHALDAGLDGLDETVRRLEGAGALVTGRDTLATLVAVGPDTIAVLGFGFTAHVPSVLDLDAVRRHVARAAAGGRRVVVTMHIGAEGATARHATDADETFAGERRGNSVAFARAAVEAGASLVVGHGPHVMRGLEWNGGALVAHSLGNLFTYGAFKLVTYNGRAAVLCATLDPDGSVRDASLTATRQPARGVVGPDPARLALRDAREVTAIDFPVTGALIGPTGAVMRRR